MVLMNLNKVHFISPLNMWFIQFLLMFNIKYFHINAHINAHVHVNVHVQYSNKQTNWNILNLFQ